MKSWIARAMNPWETSNHATHQHNQVAIRLKTHEIAQFWVIKNLSNRITQSAITKLNQVKGGPDWISMDHMIERITYFFCLFNISFGFHCSQHSCKARTITVFPSAVP